MNKKIWIPVIAVSACVVIVLSGFIGGLIGHNMNRQDPMDWFSPKLQLTTSAEFVGFNLNARTPLENSHALGVFNTSAFPSWNVSTTSGATLGQVTSTADITPASLTAAGAVKANMNVAYEGSDLLTRFRFHVWELPWQAHESANPNFNSELPEGPSNMPLLDRSPTARVTEGPANTLTNGRPWYGDWTHWDGLGNPVSGTNPANWAIQPNRHQGVIVLAYQTGEWRNLRQMPLGGNTLTGGVARDEINLDTFPHRDPREHIVLNKDSVDGLNALDFYIVGLNPGRYVVQLFIEAGDWDCHFHGLTPVAISSIAITVSNTTSGSESPWIQSYNAWKAS
jgi:hypothetical protein